jgi:hypothetical protein
MRGRTALRTMLKHFGLIAVILFASVYLAGYIVGIPGWDERGWIVAAACSSTGASVIVLMAALSGLWAVHEWKSFGLFAAIVLGAIPVVSYAFDFAGWDTNGWQFAATVCGVGALVWSALPHTLLQRLRIMPKRPPLSVTGQPRDLRKMPQSFLVDRSIRQDSSER